jgi:hypothetical protein
VSSAVFLDPLSVINAIDITVLALAALTFAVLAGAW